MHVHTCHDTRPSVATFHLLQLPVLPVLHLCRHDGNCVLDVLRRYRLCMNTCQYDTFVEDIELKIAFIIARKEIM